MLHGQTEFTMISFNINTATGDKLSLCKQKLFESNADIFAIQEHMRTEEGAGARICFSGYHTMQSYAAKQQEKGVGKRGVALAVRNHISCHCKAVNDYFILACVLLNGASVLVGSVYLPQGGRLKKKVLKSLKRAITRQSDNSDHVILMGDFNYDTNEINKVIKDIDLQVTQLVLDQPNETWHGNLTVKKKWSTIDHFLVSHDSVSLHSGTRVLQSWNISDHFAITTTITIAATMDEESGVPEPCKPMRRLRAEHIDAYREHVRKHNRFGALLEKLEAAVEPTSRGVLVEDFVNINKELMAVVADKTFGDEAKRRHRWRAPREVMKAIKVRNKLAKKTTDVIKELREDMENQHLREDAEEARQCYLRADQKVKSLVSNHRKQKFQHYVDRVVKLKSTHDSRGVWRWCHSLYSARVSKKSIAPVRNSAGELVIQPKSITNEWVQFITKQCSDVDGHSRSKNYWTAIIPPSTDRQELEGLNGVVTFKECQDCIRSMSKGKAPGASGVTVEWLALGLENPDASAPTSAFGKCLLAMVKAMVEDAIIPRSLSTSVLVLIQKPGKDGTYMGNYRGISLMESLLKVADTLVQRRICAALDRNNILSPCQGGFRNREEGIGIAVAFFEVAERRRQLKKPTYVLFMDIEKAFDSVPQEALFRKLEHVGIKGMVLNFLRATYKEANLKIRLENGLSDDINLLRGVRQGASSSPTLFNVFFDDLIKELEGTSIQVPGCEEKLPGLFFADDVMAPAESRIKLQEVANKMCKWAKKWGIKFNADKCKAMVIHGDATANNDLRQNPILLEGTTLETVDTFKYLGVTVTSSFSLDDVVAANAESLKNSLALLRPFLKANIPLNLKILVIKATVIPKALYGGELFGCDKARATKIQTAVNPFIRLALTGSEKSKSGPNIALWREAGIAPLYAQASCRRIRLYWKSASLKTWIAILYKSKFINKVKGVAWFAKTANMLARKPLKAMKESTLVTASQLSAMRDMLWSTFEPKPTADAGKHISFNRYLQFVSSSSYINTNVTNAEEIMGITILARFRTSAYVTATALAKARLLPMEFANKCPCCLDTVEETYEHILWKCKRWRRRRARMMRAILQSVVNLRLGSSSIEDYFKSCSATDAATLLLGGKVVDTPLTLCPYWQGDRKLAAAAAQNATVIVEWDHEKPLCTHIAKFLGSIHPKRLKLLWSRQGNITTSSQSLTTDTAALAGSPLAESGE
jgi:endonuclease/exonuclease/phosphatase family metal-dependent hydrolase